MEQHRDVTWSTRQLEEISCNDGPDPLMSLGIDRRNEIGCGAIPLTRTSRAGSGANVFGSGLRSKTATNRQAVTATLSPFDARSRRRCLVGTVSRRTPVRDLTGLPTAAEFSPTPERCGRSSNTAKITTRSGRRRLHRQNSQSHSFPREFDPHR